MAGVLEFTNARCKNCYKCLRECPVKAIEVVNHQAQIIEDKCILCGRCTLVCPQNAKKVHNDTDLIKEMLKGDTEVIASVAPSFASSFNIADFGIMRAALKEVGFTDAQETAIGAKMVTEEYDRLLKEGKYRNLISTACPSIVRLVRLYYPEAVKYLAPVYSPMVAHAKLIKTLKPEAKVVFIGPCIAKKREGADSIYVDGVLTFEELENIFRENEVDISKIKPLNADLVKSDFNAARFYPISRGIIKSFGTKRDGYEYVSVDGVLKCREALDGIHNLKGMFLELNACDFACVNGPCSLCGQAGSAVKATAAIRNYVALDRQSEAAATAEMLPRIDITCEYPPAGNNDRPVSEREIKEILARTGKTGPEDELNCGACGYNTCREKAVAIARGYADVDMCVPYMRERAESVSVEVIENSPNGIVVLDFDLRILEINTAAKVIWGIKEKDVKGQYAFDYFDPTDFFRAVNESRTVMRKKVEVPVTGKFVELTVKVLKEHKMLFGVMKDITESVRVGEELSKVKMKTLEITDDVIKKQMMVAQEIASLLGETTAETKIALLKLKKTLEEEKDN